MRGLSNAAAILLAVFAALLLALLADLTYVIWRQRRFRRRSLAVGAPDVSDGNPFYCTPPSKELLYFFCWKNQSRVEPGGAPSPAPPPPIPADLPNEEDDADKWQQAVLYGHTRFLFTIKEEEEREGTADQAHNSLPAKTHSPLFNTSKRASTEESSEAVGSETNGVLVPHEMVAIEVNDDEVTPFSTPCASPPYYTPSPSPGRDGIPKYSLESDGSSPDVSPNDTGIFLLEVED